MKKFIYFFKVKISDKDGIDYFLDCLGVEYSSSLSGDFRKYYVKAESQVLEKVFEGVRFKVV